MNKSFFGHPVLSGAGFDLRGGQVHGLIGENGASRLTHIRRNNVDGLR